MKIIKLGLLILCLFYAVQSSPTYHMTPELCGSYVTGDLRTAYKYGETAISQGCLNVQILNLNNGVYVVYGIQMVPFTTTKAELPLGSQTQPAQ